MPTSEPLRPSLERYQEQARDLLRAASTGDPDERTRDDAPELAHAQLTIAREHGFDSWSRFERAVELVEPFRAALCPGDAETVRKLLEEVPELAVCEPWPGVPGYKPIGGVSSGCVWHRPQQTQIAAMLVAAGAACDITVAARAGLVDRVRRLLDDDPSLVNVQDKAGRTAMYRAGCVFGIFHEGEAVVDLLLERGAELDFYVACTFSMVEDVERMLDDDPSWATRVDPDGMTSLHWAVRHRRSDSPDRPLAVTELLLDAGADANARNPQEEEMQPIHHCGEWPGHAGQVDLLLAHGADVNAAAGNGWTAFDYAMDRGRQDMVSTIEALGGRVSGKRS